MSELSIKLRELLIAMIIGVATLLIIALSIVVIINRKAYEGDAGINVDTNILVEGKIYSSSKLKDILNKELVKYYDKSFFKKKTDIKTYDRNYLCVSETTLIELVKQFDDGYTYKVETFD